MAIKIINRRLSLDKFKDYVSKYNFGSLPADKLVIHHTWKPKKEKWAGKKTIQGLKKYYEGKGWPAGPHLFIAEDGIWLFSPMRKDGIHAGKLNHRSIGIEVVGDYDHEKWSGQTKKNALGAIKLLLEHLNITAESIYFHRDVSQKTCPGSAITKEWLFKELGLTYASPLKPEASKAMKGVASVSAFIPGLTCADDEIMIPVWAAESVAWVHKNQLFEIKTDQDVRDAVKFHRFYKLMKQKQ